MNPRHFLASQLRLTMGGAMVFGVPSLQGSAEGETNAASVRGAGDATPEPGRKYELFPDIAAARQWFDRTLFNLVVDYYPETPSRPYGTGATPQNVLPVLNDLHLGCVIVYAKGHSGRTIFRSSLKTKHEMLGKDQPALFRQYTRDTGTRLFLYYSGLVDGIAGERHPDWRLKNAKGESKSSSRTFSSGRWSIMPCVLRALLR